MTDEELGRFYNSVCNYAFFMYINHQAKMPGNSSSSHEHKCNMDSQKLSLFLNRTLQCLAAQKKNSRWTMELVSALWPVHGEKLGIQPR